MKLKYSGFTLIELLVVISIIGVLIGLSVFGLQGDRESARDGTRKTDLETIRSAIEIYKSDCNSYPSGSGNPSSVLATSGTSLKGSGATTSCSSSNTYLSKIPADPVSPNRNYLYYSDGITYEICAAMEQSQSGGSVSCGGSTSCGSDPCNYKAVNP